MDSNEYLVGIMGYHGRTRGDNDDGIDGIRSLSFYTNKENADLLEEKSECFSELQRLMER